MRHRNLRRPEMFSHEPPRDRVRCARMPLRATTIRFDEGAAQLVQDAAHSAGISFSQFVREAALMRAVMRAMSQGLKTPLTSEEHARILHECSELVIARSGVDNGGES